MDANKSKPKRRMIVDLSSVLWTSLSAGEDKEFGFSVEFDGRPVKINTAVHGFENAMNLLASSMDQLELVPSDIIFVPEGLNSKQMRQMFMPTYKGGDKKSRPPEAYEEFNKLKEMLLQTWLDVGSCSAQLDGVEGDDVIGYLAKTLKGERYILSGDGDLAVLCQHEGVHLLRQGELDVNPYGPFPFKFITLYKALVGDTSDKIPGAKGFGPKAFLDTYCMFGDEGLEEFDRLIRQKKLPELAESVAELKVLQKVLDAEKTVYDSYACALIYDDLVDTLRKPLHWRAGMVKPLQKTTHEHLKEYAGKIRLIHSGNFKEALAWMTPLLAASPEVTLDIETSSSEESDDWLATVKKKSSEDDLGVDVFGSFLTGMGVTFGSNGQFTFYFTIDHVEEPGVGNITKLQALQVVKAIPQDVEIIVQNASFEQPILKREWIGDADWQNNGWHGFLPNVHDTRIAAKYVDENKSSGLKQSSKLYLGYDQQDYKSLMRMTFFEGREPFEGGREISRKAQKDLPDQLTVEYRMNEVTAKHVLAYGADDTICTKALWNFYRIRMEIENTFDVYCEVEQKAQYVTSEGFLRGVPFSLERLKQIEREDRAAADAAEIRIKQCLMDCNWEGSAPPVYTELTPAVIKEAFLIIAGTELKTMVRTNSKLAKLVEAEGEDLLARFIENDNLLGINRLVAQRFVVNPVLEVDSPKQMKQFLYKTLGLPIRIVGKLTELERENEALAKAHRKHKKIFSEELNATLTQEENDLLYKKASTDDTSVNFALAYDCEGKPELKEILEALQTIKTVNTRQKLYYTPYPLLRHWLDGKLHPSFAQSSTVTRRHNGAGPNLQQMAKEGEGVKVRSVVVPHKRKAVIISIDFAGQELRIGAHKSQDANMLACFVGENKKDMHTLTGAGAMEKRWGKAKVGELAQQYAADLEKSSADYLYDLLMRLRKASDSKVSKMANDIRKGAKPVNFGAAYGISAPTLAANEVWPVKLAQDFLDAKEAMFPDYEVWKDRVAKETKKRGYSMTMMGARRHLRDIILSPNKWEIEAAMRQASNFEIQSSAGEMVKLALSRIWDSNIYFDYDALFIAPVHDELVSSVSYENGDDDVIDFIRKKHACMVEKYADMEIEVLGSISMGPNYAVQIECGDYFDEAAIRAALQEVKRMQGTLELAEVA